VTRLATLILLVPLLLAASAPVAEAVAPLDSGLRQARAEQASAEAETRRLEMLAGKARSQAERLRAEEAAAATAIEAAEARITVADTQVRLVAAAVVARRDRLQQEQRPVASLLSGLVTMARRPPLLAIADRGSADEYVRVRLLLDSTLPLIRGRTAALSQELAQGQRLEAQAVAARAELVQSREALATRRRQFAQLEGRALAAAASAQGQALGTGDVALAAGENVEALSASQASGRSALAVASEVAAVDPAPARPAPGEGSAFRPPLDYRLPAVAPVEEGLGEVNSSGVRSRGLSLRTARGMALTVPASGVVRFSGAYRQHDGVVIIDHGNGWMSLIVGVSSPLKAGARVRVGEPLGRALGPLQVELSQNGRRISPALIAGSSQTVSNVPKAG